MNICAYTSVCEEDARWLPQYLREAERLWMPFVMHFDRWSEHKTAMEIFLHPLCEGVQRSLPGVEEFDETQKQPLLDAVVSLGFDYAMAWDVDETYERDFMEEVEGFVKYETDWDCLDVKWKNLWGDPQYIRVDGCFSEGHRVKLYRLQGRLWKFESPITNGAKLQQRPEVVAYSDMVCLHWGMMTKEDRLLHKARWDRIYTAAVGANPYGFWDSALDESITPTLVKHDYF